jgi:hypothetical protein
MSLEKSEYSFPGRYSVKELLAQIDFLNLYIKR